MTTYANMLKTKTNAQIMHLLQVAERSLSKINDERPRRMDKATIYEDKIYTILDELEHRAMGSLI